MRCIVSRHHSTIGQHHQHRTTEALCRKPLLQLVEVRSDDRHRGGVTCGGDHARVLANLRRDVTGDAHGHTQRATEVLGNHSLVGRVGVGVDETNANRFNIGAAQLLGDHGERSCGGGVHHDTESVGALGDLEHPITRYGRGRELDLQVVHVVAMLVADLQRVAEARRGDDTGPTDLALDQRIGDERGGMHDWLGDVGRFHSGLGQHLANSSAYSIEWGVRGGECLFHEHPSAERVEQYEVGERAADVDRQPPVTFGLRTHTSADCVAGSDCIAGAERGGENTSRIHTSFNSSSPMKLLSPCQMLTPAR